MGKRVAIFMVLTAVMAGTIPAAAGTSRTVEKAYGFEVNPSGTSGSISYLGTVEFDTRPGERFVTIEVVDESGQPVAFDVRQGGKNGIDVDGCGSTASPVSIRGGAKLEVATLIHFSQDGQCQLSLPTSGVIKATFTG